MPALNVRALYSYTSANHISAHILGTYNTQNRVFRQVELNTEVITI